LRQRGALRHAGWRPRWRPSGLGGPSGVHVAVGNRSAARSRVPGRGRAPLRSSLGLAPRTRRQPVRRFVGVVWVPATACPGFPGPAPHFAASLVVVVPPWSRTSGPWPLFLGPSFGGKPPTNLRGSGLNPGAACGFRSIACWVRAPPARSPLRSALWAIVQPVSLPFARSVLHPLVPTQQARIFPHGHFG